jgi:hypothetical protein
MAGPMVLTILIALQDVIREARSTREATDIAVASTEAS